MASTVDPSAITNLDEWLLFFKAKKTNVRLGSHGQYLVYDTRNSSLVKTISHLPKDFDYVSVLTSESTQLRDLQNLQTLQNRAEAKRTEVLEARNALIQTAETEFLKAEQALLQETDAWDTASLTGDQAGRHAKALLIGTLSLALREKETILQKARYPIRYVPKEPRELQRKDIDIATHDPRKIDIHQVLYQEVPLSSRTVTPLPLPQAAPGANGANGSNGNNNNENA